nr:immunoglobulin light chain junction region [Macaca mulatta]
DYYCQLWDSSTDVLF